VIPNIAYIEIDAEALRHNARKVREYAPESKIIAVIKGNAYGHGLTVVANILQNQVDAFAVARLSEAVILRNSGIENKILVLQGFGSAKELELFSEYKLDSIVHCAEQVALLEQTSITKLNVWLKIDTGMHRLGIEPEQFKLILHRLRECSAVATDIRFVTHFANADDLHDTKTLQQWMYFEQIISGEVGEISAANSAGVIEWADTRQDWVRPGLMLYGASPIMGQSAEELGLQPVMSFYAPVIAIKSVKAGEYVGYARAWSAKKDTLVAVIAVGYGDGYSRHVKVGTKVMINGEYYPTVGRVSMDMISVNITENPEIKIGDRVTLWGKGLPVDKIAKQANTIAYTLLCGITQRVPVKITE